MTEEGRQTDQARVRIEARSIPAQQGSDCEGMPQIVQPWGAYAGRHLQLKLRQQRVNRFKSPSAPGGWITPTRDM